MLNKMNS